MSGIDRIKNVHGQTLELLGESIVSGKYAVGEVLPREQMLCDELGISRTIVREAVKSLVAKGLLMTGPKVGTRVQPFEAWNWFDPDLVAWQLRVGITRDFLRDLQELRSIVEPAGVRLAAERATPQDIAEIEAAFAGMVQAVADGGDYVTSDLRFHQGLLRASRNRMLMQMSKALTAVLRASFALSTAARPDSAARSLPLHRAVIDAVIAGKPDRAEGAIRVLIDGAARDIEPMLGSRRKMPALGAPERRPGPSKR
jgi:DNA-binding FadR family transcriptional regulator